jgi:hypothetical protein
METNTLLSKNDAISVLVAHFGTLANIPFGSLSLSHLMALTYKSCDVTYSVL